MPRMTGGEAIVDSLLRHGIDTVFGLPGVQMYGLFDAFARNANRIRVINARHEQTTAYMALGYACATGKPAVYSVVPGPGLLNTTAALSTAWSVNAPVLCLTGQVPSSQIGRLRGQLHELPDQLATLRTLVRHADRIEDPTEAPRKVARAFQEMLSGRPGPVALEVPLDQLPAEAEVTPCDPLPLHPAPAPDPAKIARLADMIDAARNPMIWVGAGAMDAGPEIRALAEKIGAPVVRYRGGRGVLDDRHPLSLTVPEGYRLWPETDLLIGIGTRLDVPTARWGKLPDGVRIARIDIDPAEFRRLSVDLGIVADAADATRALTQAVAGRDDPDRAARIARAKAEVAAEIQSVQPQMSFLEAIRDALPEDGIFCDEMTQVGYVSAFGMPFHAPRTAIGSGFSGNLGAGFPTALGVKVAHPGRAVVAVTGDGGFLFGGSDLATAVRYGINLVTVLFNNNSYGNVLRDQRRLYDGRHCGAELTNPDFQTYAKAFGVRSWRVTDAAGLRSALGEALVTNAPCLIEVMTDITKEPSPFRFLAPHRP
ncbi:thiamine pyrophosphate-dependent enzyme [Elioraea tepidiphila]|jgi:acetolactate synthase-1/2/3 large subunit|uniref:thiamine pyrophosphate-dependent enzyme n=1 Tax=Elioraea tepidiphila TaxID=457934 RepID=UPI000375BCE1|nr:thiamine pyrophosphate-dependent enzyme [Elioraea tepidiphila]